MGRYPVQAIPFSVTVCVTFRVLFTITFSARECCSNGNTVSDTIKKTRNRRNAPIVFSSSFSALEGELDACGHVVGLVVGAEEFTIVVGVDGNAFAQ